MSPTWKHWLAPFRTEFSGQAALQNVRQIATWHRIQASPGYRAAASWCTERLQAAGLQAELVAHPARPDHYHGNSRSFREWHCRAAELMLVAPHQQRLCSYEAMEMSIIQRSTSTPPGGIEAELIFVERADRPESYEGIDVTDKIVLCCSAIHRSFEEAVVQRGALGLVVDVLPAQPPVRTREMMPDVVPYTSFWWFDEQQTGWGFSLSPRQGDLLRDLLNRGPVRVRATVDAALYNGTFENVEALLPGESAEEVLLISHLCHPKPGANDNASGPAVLLEVARGLNRLVQDGVLPRPKRSVRFLMIPEMTGTHAYIHQHPERIAQTVAALNLDMVGGSPLHGAGPLTIERPSPALPSYVHDLICALYEEVAASANTLAGNFPYPVAPYVATPYSGGSDHYILNDPLVGVACPMLITWPDRWYHTSHDLPEHLDPALLERVALATAAYLWWIANATLPQVLELAGRMVQSFGTELERIKRDCRTNRVPLDRSCQRLHFATDRRLADIRSLARLLPEEEQTTFAAFVTRKSAALEAARASAEEDLLALDDAGPVAATRDVVEPAVTEAPLLQHRFTRKHAGPVELMGFLPLLSPEEQQAYRTELEQIAHTTHTSAMALTYTVAPLLLFWMDGQRTLGEVVDMVELETGQRYDRFALSYAKLLQRLHCIS